MFDSENEKAGGEADKYDAGDGDDAVPIPIHNPVPIPPPVSPTASGARGVKAGGGDSAKAEKAVPSLSSDVAAYRGDEVKGLIHIKASKLRDAAARRRQRLSREMKEQKGSGGGGSDPPPHLEDRTEGHSYRGRKQRDDSQRRRGRQMRTCRRGRRFRRSVEGERRRSGRLEA